MADFEILARADFSEHTYLLEVRHPQMAKAARPGQFVIVMEHEHGERIPLTIADADLIIVLEDGAVAGSGTHDELLAGNATYREIVESQLGADEAA